jgi:hypothetical protein
LSAWILVGPLKTTRNGNQFFVFAIDKFTKFLEGTATKSFICRHVVVETILTDRGVNFESFLFKHLCTLASANKARTTAFHQQANGEGTERGCQEALSRVWPNLWILIKKNGMFISRWPSLLTTTVIISSIGMDTVRGTFLSCVGQTT